MIFPRLIEIGFFNLKLKLNFVPLNCPPAARAVRVRPRLRHHHRRRQPHPLLVAQRELQADVQGALEEAGQRRNGRSRLLQRQEVDDEGIDALVFISEYRTYCLLGTVGNLEKCLLYSFTLMKQTLLNPT